MARLKRPSNKPSQYTLREFHQNRNKVLVIRETGGLGDILMHRMMFEDFKLLAPDLKLVFACPRKYHTAVEDHPFVDEVVDSQKVDAREYIAYYTTTSACTRHEMALAPLSMKHRSDIWANHCGVELTRHNMHIRLEPEYVQQAQERLKRDGADGPTIALCPMSAMITKNLTEQQQLSLVGELQKRGYFVYALHHKPLPHLPIPVWHDLSIRQWMGAIEAADYVVTVDTAGFHYAGGVGKPLTGIFTFADGKVYGRYYDHILVQKHRDNGDWDCGPCYYWPTCPKTKTVPKPCLTEITIDMIMDGIEKMFEKWPDGCQKAKNFS